MNTSLTASLQLVDFFLKIANLAVTEILYSDAFVANQWLLPWAIFLNLHS